MECFCLHGNAMPSLPYCPRQAGPLKHSAAEFRPFGELWWKMCFRKFVSRYFHHLPGVNPFPRRKGRRLKCDWKPLSLLVEVSRARGACETREGDCTGLRRPLSAALVWFVRSVLTVRFVRLGEPLPSLHASEAKRPRRGRDTTRARAQRHTVST